MSNVALTPAVARQRPDGRTIRVALVACAATVALLYAWPYTMQMLRGVRLAHLADFGRMYYSARQFVAGHGLYGPSPVVFDRGAAAIHNLNPPQAHLPFLLVSRLPEGAAFVVGLVIACAALLLSLRAGLRETGHSSWTTAGVIVLLAPLLLPTQAAIGTGQFFAWWLVPLFTLAWRAARRDRWRTAGAWLGILAGLKLFVLLFLPYLLITRRWKAAVWFAVAMAASVGAGIAIFGWASYLGWTNSLREATWYGNQVNGSLLGLLERLFGGIGYRPTHMAPGDFATYGAVWLAPWLVKPLYYAAAAVVLAVTARAASGGNIDRAFAVVLLSALLVSPLGSIYYLWLAAAPLIVVFATDLRARGALVLAVPFALIPVHRIEFGQPSPWGTAIFGCAAGWLVLALWCAVVSAPVVAAGRNRYSERMEVCG